jgi:hypothetical protein
MGTDGVDSVTPHWQGNLMKDGWQRIKSLMWTWKHLGWGVEGLYYFHSPRLKKSAHKTKWGSNLEPVEYKSTLHQVPIFGLCNDKNLGLEKFESRSDWE